MRISDILREYVRKQRRHAGFFWWHDRSAHGKAIAEVGAVESLLASMRNSGGSSYTNPRPSFEAWPDCVVSNEHRGLVAFEVTELVDKHSAVDGKPRLWSPDRFLNTLQDTVLNKDAKSFHGGKYAEVVLLVHTDEHALDAGQVQSDIAGRTFRLKHGNLNRAFLLFGYAPKLRGCPFVELRLVA